MDNILSDHRNEINYNTGISNITRIPLYQGSVSYYSLSTDPVVSYYYSIIVPFMICICFLAFLGNVYILACIRWIRTTGLTINLILSLSLCGADAWAAILVLVGLVMNSYLPAVYGVSLGRWSVCYFLLFELIRLSGMITSIMHLVALALNHWFSIISPLKYKTAVTTGWCKVIILLLWAVPLVVMGVATLCVPGQGFRGGGEPNWCNIDFYFHFPFRLVIFLQFVVPLITMFIIYGYILRQITTIRNTKLKQDDSRKALLMRKRRSRDNVKEDKITTSNTVDRARVEIRRKSNVHIRANCRINVLQSKIKALTTTLLILGTFALGWLPAVTQFTLVCKDCAINFHPPRLSLFAVGVVVNLLIIIKLLVNPFIYAFRILDIRYALWHMHITRYGCRPMPVQLDVPDEFRNLDNRRRTSRQTSTTSGKSKRTSTKNSYGTFDAEV